MRNYEKSKDTNILFMLERNCIPSIENSNEKYKLIFDNAIIDGKQNDYLQRVSLSVTDNLECRVQHNTSKEIPCGINTSNMICAGGHVNTDVCHGNSGNPLQITEHFCMHHIIGINSFGQSCRSTDSYGVYTRVSHYISWIKNIVWPQQK